MKRFMLFAVGICYLAVCMLGHSAQAQVPSNATYFAMSNGMVGAILPDGRTYLASMDNIYFQLGPSIFAGNYWAGISNVPSVVEFFVRDNGLIIAIVPNGDVYRGQITGMHLDATVYSGNIWQGVVATSKSTLGGAKDQYKK